MELLYLHAATLQKSIIFVQDATFTNEHLNKIVI
jgi:hypothetical protein